MEAPLTKQEMKRVAGSFLFARVDEIVVEQMVLDDRCQKRTYEKGQIIFDETHFHRSLGILLSGEVLVEKNTGGTRLIMSRLGPGDCFGAAAMFHSRNRYATILTARKATDVLFLSQELIAWAMRRDPEITENYISYLSDRIWFLNQKLSALTAGTTEQKLAVFLLGRSEFTSMTDLSQQLHVGRASLYRALDAMEGRGLIRRDGKSVELLDEDGLLAISAGA